MANYRLSQRARRDLVEIRSYIAKDSEAAADRFIDPLVDSFRRLGQNTYLGRSRDELGQGCRSFMVGRYVLHGKRDVPRLFRQ